MERHPELMREILSQVAARSTNTDDPALIDENIGDFTRREVYGHVWKGYDELDRLRSR